MARTGREARQKIRETSILTSDIFIKNDIHIFRELFLREIVEDGAFDDARPARLEQRR